MGKIVNSELLKIWAVCVAINDVMSSPSTNGVVDVRCLSAHCGVAAHCGVVAHCHIVGGVSDGKIVIGEGSDVKLNFTAKKAGRTGNSIRINYDGRSIINAKPGGMSCTPTGRFDFGNQTVSLQGDKYSFAFTFEQVNFTTDNSKKFTFQVITMGQSFNGTLTFDLLVGPSLVTALPKTYDVEEGSNNIINVTLIGRPAPNVTAVMGKESFNVSRREVGKHSYMYAVSLTHVTRHQCATHLNITAAGFNTISFQVEIIVKFTPDAVVNVKAIHYKSKMVVVTWQSLTYGSCPVTYLVFVVNSSAFLLRTGEPGAILGNNRSHVKIAISAVVNGREGARSVPTSILPAEGIDTKGISTKYVIIIVVVIVVVMVTCNVSIWLLKTGRCRKKEENKSQQSVKTETGFHNVPVDTQPPYDYVTYRGPAQHQPEKSVSGFHNVTDDSQVPGFHNVTDDSQTYDEFTHLGMAMPQYRPQQPGTEKREPSTDNRPTTEDNRGKFANMGSKPLPRVPNTEKETYDVFGPASAHAYNEGKTYDVITPGGIAQTYNDGQHHYANK